MHFTEMSTIINGHISLQHRRITFSPCMHSDLCIMFAMMMTYEPYAKTVDLHYYRSFMGQQQTLEQTAMLQTEANKPCLVIPGNVTDITFI